MPRTNLGSTRGNHSVLGNKCQVSASQDQIDEAVMHQLALVMHNKLLLMPQGLWK